MPKWKTKPLGELCQLINGRAFKPSDWGTTGLPIVRIQNLNDETKPFNHYDGEYHEKHFIDDGEILLSWSGTPGTSFGCFRWTRGPGILNQHIFKVMPSREMDGDFFIHAVNSKLDEMIAKAHGGVGLRHITKGKLEGISLPVPSIEEQRRISTRIDACFGLIKEAIHLRADTSQACASVLKSFYNEQCQQLRASRECIPLCEVGDVTGGGTPSKRNQSYWAGDIPWVSPRDMKCRELTRTKHRITADAVSGSSTRLIAKPSVLFVVRGMILSHTLPIAVARMPLTINQDMKAITPDSRFLVDYIAAIMRGVEAELLAKIEIAGHGTCRLQTAAWASTAVPLISIEEQESFVSRAHQVEQAVAGLVTETSGDEISRLGDAILRKAFAGEL